VINFIIVHNAIDALTSTSSHELCEAITDPIPGQGWYDDANGEIGDICAWKSKNLEAVAQPSFGPMKSTT
jgi:hypothetical protein